MALKATIYKAELTISDMDRNHYATYPLTIAQHPSETTERMMLRLAVFARHASESLEFSRGLSSEDEPDLWQRSYSNEIELWIELGTPDEKRLRKACGRSQNVILYGYHGNAFDIWWQQNKDKCRRLSNLTVYRLSETLATELQVLCARTMRLQATLQDGNMWLGNDVESIEVTPDLLFSGADQ
ncbi:MAG: YaeQ family protein [Oleibacter sp.]|nr:YaeQ family protein [Thalassolituus sp.]